MAASRVFLLLAAMVAAAPVMAQTRANEAGRSAYGDRSDKHPSPRAWRDGIVVNQFDNEISRQTFWSDGRSATQFGSIVIYNDGTLATQSGDRTIFGNGRSCAQFGIHTICD
jgi:hypothetical protein